MMKRSPAATSAYGISPHNVMNITAIDAVIEPDVGRSRLSVTVDMPLSCLPGEQPRLRPPTTEIGLRPAVGSPGRLARPRPARTERAAGSAAVTPFRAGGLAPRAPFSG